MQAPRLSLSRSSAGHKIASIGLFNLLSPLDRHNIVKYEFEWKLSSAELHVGVFNEIFFKP